MTRGFLASQLTLGTLFFRALDGSVSGTRPDRIVTERFSDRTRYTLHGGEARIVDATGTVRVRVWDDDAIFRLDATVESDEANFHFGGLGVDGHYLPVRIHLNPGGSNGDLSHGAVRWNVLQPDESGKPLRLKMQLVYDQHNLCQEKGRRVGVPDLATKGGRRTGSLCYGEDNWKGLFTYVGARLAIVHLKLSRLPLCWSRAWPEESS